MPVIEYPSQMSPQMSSRSASIIVTCCVWLVGTGCQRPAQTPSAAARQGLASCTPSSVATDCPAVGDCLSSACTGNVCTSAPAALCLCGGDDDCDDGNPCTVDGCGLGLCAHTPTPTATGCCSGAGDCAPPANACQTAA